MHPMFRLGYLLKDLMAMPADSPIFDAAVKVSAYHAMDHDIMEYLDSLAAILPTYPGASEDAIEFMLATIAGAKEYLASACPDNAPSLAR